MYVINLLGEPSVGKSATSGGVIYELGVNGFKAELVGEVAKGFAWETPKNPTTGESLIHPIFGQQIYLLGEQNRWLERVNEKRDFAVMECPLIMTAIYQPENYLEYFKNVVLEQFNKYNNINFLIQRNHSFDPDGRVHNEEEARKVREKLINFMRDNNIPYVNVKTGRNIHKQIVKYVTENYSPNKKLLDDYNEIDISGLLETK